MLHAQHTLDFSSTRHGASLCCLLPFITSCGDFMNQCRASPGPQGASQLPAYQYRGNSGGKAGAGAEGSVRRARRWQGDEAWGTCACDRSTWGAPIPHCKNTLNNLQKALTFQKSSVFLLFLLIYFCQLSQTLIAIVQFFLSGLHPP